MKIQKVMMRIIYKKRNEREKERGNEVRSHGHVEMGNRRSRQITEL